MAKPPDYIQLLKNETVPGEGATTHTALRTSNYWKKTVYVESTAQVTVKVQAGRENSDGTFTWHDVKSGYTSSAGGSADDADYSHDCTNETICFDVDVHMAYMRVVVSNAGASPVTGVNVGVSWVGQ